MKTAEEWANWHDNRLPAEEIQQIQLDAMKEGMLKVAETPCLCYLADDGVGVIDSSGKWRLKPQTKVICKRCAILTAAEQLTEKDLWQNTIQLS